MFRKKTVKTIFELTHEKYRNKIPISYEEYVILLSTNDEIWFEYKELEYQVNRSDSDTTSMIVSRINGSKYTVVRVEDYQSIVDLLHNFRVDGLLIKEIWSKTSIK